MSFLKKSKVKDAMSMCLSKDVLCFFYFILSVQDCTATENLISLCRTRTCLFAYPGFLFACPDFLFACADCILVS